MPLKIAPTQAKPGEPFTIVDTPDGRLVDGSVAVFRLATGAMIEASLRTHNPHKTAQGRLPLSIPGGEYSVAVRLPSGEELALGSFTVLAEAPTEATISPAQGPVGTSFTISDPEARIESGDRAIFYQEGTDPEFGVQADEIAVSADGMTLSARVPSAPSAQYFIAVRPSATLPSRFGDLPFFVTAS